MNLEQLYCIKGNHLQLDTHDFCSLRQRYTKSCHSSWLTNPQRGLQYSYILIPFKTLQGKKSPLPHLVQSWLHRFQARRHLGWTITQRKHVLCARFYGEKIRMLCPQDWRQKAPFIRDVFINMYHLQGSFQRHQSIFQQETTFCAHHKDAALTLWLACNHELSPTENELQI